MLVVRREIGRRRNLVMDRLVDDWMRKRVGLGMQQIPTATRD
jgi:hypothetical protein